MASLFVESDARLSPCGLYRYTLTRTWDATKPRACWIGLNPSTADASEDDPTIRRMCGFADAWKCGGIIVVNLFALRATDPKELRRVKDPVGPENGVAIIDAAKGSKPVVAAWGTHGRHYGRDQYVLELLGGVGVPLLCLGQTQHGNPKHPLYLKADAALVEFPNPFLESQR